MFPTSCAVWLDDCVLPGHLLLLLSVVFFAACYTGCTSLLPLAIILIYIYVIYYVIFACLYTQKNLLDAQLVRRACFLSFHCGCGCDCDCAVMLRRCLIRVRARVSLCVRADAR
jgi:hypothetical protein